MDRASLRESFDRSFPVEPIVSVIVPEDRLKLLVLAARSIVFEIDNSLDPSRVLELDRASEEFADMLDLDDTRQRREELRRAADRVRDWLDSKCLTLVPLEALETLVAAWE